MTDFLPNFRRWFSSSPAARCRPDRRLYFEALEPRRMLDGAGGLLGFAAEGERSPVPEFALPDVNPTSSSFNQLVSPRDHLQQVSAWYFGQSTWGYCNSQFGYLEVLQSELNSTYPELHISILGINEVGHEAGNSVISQGRDLPWLQSLDDGPSAAARELWQATFRDVVILDGENVQVGVYNLTQNDLADPQSYDTLREMLVDAAMEYQKPWRNSLNPLDVNNDGHISPIDALLVINALNRDGSHRLPPPTTANTAPPYFDTNGDGFISPVDALMVINALIRPSGMKGEGESPPSAGAAAAVFPVESGLQREPLPPMTTNPGPPERLPRPLPVALDDSRPIGPVLQPDEVRDSVFADPLLDWFVLDDESLSTEYWVLENEAAPLAWMGMPSQIRLQVALDSSGRR